MQRLQRKAGQLLHRSPDDAEVGLLLADFENGDKLLTTVRAPQLMPAYHLRTMPSICHSLASTCSS